MQNNNTTKQTKMEKRKKRSIDLWPENLKWLQTIREETGMPGSFVFNYILWHFRNRLENPTEVLQDARKYRELSKKEFNELTDDELAFLLTHRTSNDKIL